MLTAVTWFTEPTRQNRPRDNPEFLFGNNAYFLAFKQRYLYMLTNLLFVKPILFI